jgi:hypothetical protein
MEPPTVLLDEDFSGDFPPEGWSMDGWEQYNSSCCGSEPPCAIWYKYNQHPPYYGPHVTSKAVDASEYEKFVLSFYFGVDVYYNNYVQVYLKYRRNETNPWIDITPWCNPITSDMCDYYEIKVICGSECCGDALQINWSYVGYYYGINYCWLDNVKILSGFDDTPPVTNCSLDPPEPNGDNGWYITDVNVTLDATDDISGVKEIHYRINDDEWNTYYGDFLTFVLDYDCLKNASIEYYSVDNAENQEETKILEGIYIDQEPPYFDAQYEILSGNPKDGWLIGVNASNIIDDCSGWSGRVEFLLNGVLQDTVTGPEPEYMWQFY